VERAGSRTTLVEFEWKKTGKEEEEGRKCRLAYVRTIDPRVEGHRIYVSVGCDAQPIGYTVVVNSILHGFCTAERAAFSADMRFRSRERRASPETRLRQVFFFQREKTPATFERPPELKISARS